ncbi:DNA/RNA endonuclease G, NUC1 [Cylindrospermum stagnale PCC 7417]|uniref:DNA/RNA endonuclease G, NUC1 n=1 Tax=Cylindrospermum stagnale PCC 7417 TaxID=56107 RepID=K9X584_9NOST|nr:DNA/RNA non-specific endonuclease [Cylindrospermum stagnale]AFZ27264.1 DNA/RNA endonuclease G, NUC1 [Cylindrospermum stagnale PCC 7417]
MLANFWRKVYRSGWLTGIVIVLLVTFNTLFSAKGATTVEGFETGSKGSYAAADVTLSTGVWNLDDALIGNLAADAKSGTQSTRIRNSGKATMKFNRTTGAGTVTIKHGKYGSDASTNWSLWCSTNSGSSWSQVGSTVTTSSTTLATATFTPNISGTVRCEVRKTDGTTNRTNIDDITITDYGTSGGGSASVHLTMGNPSGAVTSTSYPGNYLMEKDQYALSYNNTTRIPNWTSWQLNSSWLGSTPRQDDFRNDTTLPSGWYQVLATDYQGSGFDRGHMTPSGDRTSTVAVNSSTFLMTNMIPQAPDNNQGPWAILEGYARDLVAQGKELYIISGGYGVGGTGSNGSASTIASGKIQVPARTWKVIVVLDTPGSGVSGVTTNTRVIAVDMPNAQGIRNNDWKTYRVSVDSIEGNTGFNFLSNVSVGTQDVIESRVDNL